MQKLLRICLPLLLFLSLFGFIFFILVHQNEDIVRLTSVQILILILAMVWTVRMLWKGNVKFASSFLNFPVFLFLCAGLISLIRATNPYQGLIELSNTAFYILLYFLILNNATQENIVNNFIYSLLILTTIIAIHGIFQYIRLDFLWFMFPPGASINRVSSVFGNADFLGGYLAMVFPVSFSMFLFRKRKILFGISSITIFISLLLTFTRSAWVSFGLSFIFLLVVLFIYRPDVISKNKVWLLSVLIVFVLLVIVLNFTTGYGIFSRFFSIFNWSGYNVQVRFGLWSSALNIFKRSPVTGIGLDNFKIVGQGCRIHNEYLQILAEMGIIGIGVFAWLIFSYFKESFLALKNSSAYRQILIISLMAAAFSMLIDSLFCFPLHRVSHNVLFWSLLGLTLAVGNIRTISAPDMNKQKELKQRQRYKFVSITVILFVAFAIFLILRSFTGVYYYQKGFELNRYADQSPQIREKTKQLFEKAAKLCPFNYQIQHDWAIVAIQAQELDKGIRAMHWSEKLYPNRLPDVRLNLGLLYYEKKDYEKAEEVWLETIEKFPSCAQAYFYLGGLYANQNKLDEGIKYCLRATEIEPDNLDYWEACAKVYLRKRDLSNARKSVEKGLSLNPQDEELKKMAQILGRK